MTKAMPSMSRLALVAALIASACEPEMPQTLEFSGNTMGTQFSVTLVTDISTFDGATLKDEIVSALEQVEQMMSTYRRDSEISLFNANHTTDWQEVSAAFCFSVAEALKLSEFTDGSFDVSVGPLVNLWGFGPDDDIVTPPTGEDIDDAMQFVGFDRLQANCEISALRKDISGLAIDLSAFGKGFAVDRIAGDTSF